MRYSLLALASGNMAIAMFTNTTDGPAAGKAVSNTMPPVVGDYELFGCSAANDDMKSFVQVASSDDMDLDFCSASCKSKFMAVGGKNCFCGDNADTAQKLDAGMCNSPCPGNRSQSCGGSGGNTRRDDAAHMKAFSMYMRAGAANADGAPTKTTTKVATMANVETKVADACHMKKIICYGGHCAPESSCGGEKQRVICDGNKCHSETCYSKQWSSLVLCEKNDCKWSTCDDNRWFENKIVCDNGKCAWEKCQGDECYKKFVCKGSDCKHEKCSGDDCHKKYTCDAKGDNCKHDRPCGGKECPRPPPPCHDNCPKPAPCQGKDCNEPAPCQGDNCKLSCNGRDCVKPVRPTGSVTGSILPQPIPTNAPIVAGAGNMVANVIGAAAGLLFVL